jgi:hypothetical protein
MENNAASDVLAGRYTQMKVDSGLVDVKFLLRNTAEATTEQVCREVEAMYSAFDRGEYKKLDFNDRSATNNSI